jgi:glycolate oxidase FAD binding subunit
MPMPFWEGVREQSDPWFVAAREAKAPLWRMSVKASAPYLDLGGEQLIEWSGALRWLVATERTDAGAGAGVCARERRPRDAVSRAGTARRSARSSVTGHVARASSPAEGVFDPDGILNPGRLYPGL